MCNIEKKIQKKNLHSMRTNGKESLIVRFFCINERITNSENNFKSDSRSTANLESTFHAIGIPKCSICYK